MTLVEMIVVLVILTVLTSIIVPSMIGYINRAKQQKYVMEAQEVKQSLELYLLDQNLSGDLDMMEFLDEISAQDLNDPECPVSDYMKITCTDGAYVQNLTMEENGIYIQQLDYVVDGYKIEVGQGKYSVTSLKNGKK